MTRNCMWCGGPVPNEVFSTARLVRHRGKLELWCDVCVKEDAIGEGTTPHSKDKLKRKMDRPKHRGEE